MFILEAVEDLKGDLGVDGDGVGMEGLRLDALGLPICAVEVALRVEVFELLQALLVEAGGTRSHAAKDLVENEVDLVAAAELVVVAVA